MKKLFLAVAIIISASCSAQIVLLGHVFIGYDSYPEQQENKKPDRVWKGEDFGIYPDNNICQQTLIQHAIDSAYKLPGLTIIQLLPGDYCKKNGESTGFSFKEGSEVYLIMPYKKDKYGSSHCFGCCHNESVPQLTIGVKTPAISESLTTKPKRAF